MTRIKTVFTESEIAHVWANQGAATGYTTLVSLMNGGKGRRQSFDGDAFHSYSTTIARRIRHKGKVAYVLDAESFRPTTAKHLAGVRHAIKDADKVFTVHVGNRGQSLSFTPASLRDHYLSAYRKTVPASRYKHVNAARLLARLRHLDTALQVCILFGLPHKTIDRERVKMHDERQTAVSIHHAKEGAQRKAREDRWTKRREEQIAREAGNVAQAIQLAIDSLAEERLPDGYQAFGWQDRYLDSRPDLKTGIADLRAKQDAATLADWLAGKPAIPKHDWPTLLRAEGEEMVTTRGARVPLAAAKRTYAFIMARRKTGWHTNGEQHEIGMYQLEAVNEHGVVVGCHRVTWAEVDRFAALMGWV